MPVFSAEGDLTTKIVAVSALAVYYLAEKPEVDHVLHHKLVPAVAAVFEQHHGRFRALKGPYEQKAILDAVSAPDLDSDGYTRLHEGDRHLYVRLPGAGHEHRVELFSVGHGVPVVGDARREALTLLYLGSCRLGAVVVEIADKADRNAVDTEDGLHDLAAAATHTYHADPEFFIHRIALRFSCN